MNKEATITIRRGHSDDGGFDYAQMASEELTFHELYALGEQLYYVGSLKRIGGYELVSDYAISQLGETFTVQQLLDYVGMMKQRIAEREERRRQGMVTCDCGHTVHKSEVMWASMGSACPDCYDRMS